MFVVEGSYTPLFVQKIINHGAQTPLYVCLPKLFIEGIITAGTILAASFAWSLNLLKRSFGEGMLYLRGLFIVFFFDATLTDDEPL